MAQAQAITLGDQVRLRFIGWPPTVKQGMRDGTTVDVPHPKTGQPFVPTWNSRPYPVTPGQDIYVPFELAKVYFGDPRSIENVFRIKDEYGSDQIVPDRFAEVRRLRTYWQNNIITFREYIPGDHSFANEPISDLIPLVEIYSMSGERIMMVTDDPQGNTVVVDNRARADENKTQQVMIEQSDAIVQLRKQNALLLRKLGIREEDLLSLDDPAVKPIAPIKVDSVFSAPETATVQSAPVMAYNPRTRRVEQRKVPESADSNIITELPVDMDD